MNHELDLTTDIIRDITVNKNRSLNERLKADIFDCGQYCYSFDFTCYTGATLEVRLKQNDSSQLILKFSTVDGSLVLDSDGIFHLIKSASDMNALRSGEYFYDMYLTSLSETKRAFMHGKFMITDTVSR